MKVRYFTFELSACSTVVNYNKDEIILKSTVTVSSYIEPIDFIKIHVGDLDIDIGMYWGEPE